MIFLTVGTQLPFDRMVSAVNAWAAKSEEEIVAQVGPTKRNFPHLRQQEFLDPVDFDRYFEQARLIVSHAGIGSIIGALSYGKPIIIIPRKADLGEHRNNHQIATAKRFTQTPSVYVAWDEKELINVLTALLERSPRTFNVTLPSVASDDFIRRLRSLINGEYTP